MGATLGSAVTAAENPAAVQVIKNVSETITKANAATTAATSPIDRILEIINNVSPTTAGATGGDRDTIRGPFNIIIQIDRDKIGEKVAEYIQRDKIMFVV